MYTAPAPKASPPPAPPAPVANGGGERKPAVPVSSKPSTNGAKAVDFVSEDDVRRALQKGEKIYVNAKTIITPAARDMGEPAEVFAKV